MTEKRKTFKIINRVVYIVSESVSFLLTLLTLAQFTYVDRVFRFEITFVANTVFECVWFYTVSYLNKRKGNFLQTNPNRDGFTAKLNAVIFGLRLLSAIVIISLVLFGKLTEIEHVELSTKPVAIIYMVAVFLTVFLIMFSLWARLVLRETYDKRRKPSQAVGRKVKVDIDKSLQLPEEKEKKTPSQVFCGVVSGINYRDNQKQSAYVTGMDLPYNTFSGVVTAVVVRRDGSDVWVVVPENYKISDKEMQNRIGPYEANDSIDKIVR